MFRFQYFKENFSIKHFEYDLLKLYVKIGERKKNGPYVSVAFWIKENVHTRHIKYISQPKKKKEKKT